MINLTAIIVDDESRGRKSLKSMLENYCPQVQLIGEGANVAEASQLLKEHCPDILFLDIEMPDGTGFDLLKLLPEVQTNIIFTTAYGHYAINAIRFCALDYLLKPINITELVSAVNKVLESKMQQSSDHRVQQLLENMAEQESKDKRIGIPTQQSIEFIAVADIIRCEAEGSYTKFFLKASQVLMATGSIKHFSELLAPYGCYRTHNSHLINLVHIKRFVKVDGGYVVMDDEAEVPVSRRKRDEFLELLKSPI